MVDVPGFTVGMGSIRDGFTPPVGTGFDGLIVGIGVFPEPVGFGTTIPGLIPPAFTCGRIVGVSADMGGLTVGVCGLIVGALGTWLFPPEFTGGRTVGACVGGLIVGCDLMPPPDCDGGRIVGISFATG